MNKTKQNGVINNRNKAQVLSHVTMLLSKSLLASNDKHSISTSNDARIRLVSRCLNLENLPEDLHPVASWKPQTLEYTISAMKLDGTPHSVHLHHACCTEISTASLPADSSRNIRLNLSHTVPQIVFPTSLSTFLSTNYWTIHKCNKISRICSWLFATFTELLSSP